MMETSTAEVRVGMLHIVGTPLGNIDDISARAVRTLRDADIIACEERRVALRLLKQLGLSTDKELIEVNEHTESVASDDVVAAMLAGKRVALISDCGMPVFADPGAVLVRKTWEAGLNVDASPGPTSVMTAIALSGIDMQTFFFRGFLSAKREERIRQLRQLRSVQVPIVLMDTPYRLARLLEDAVAALGGDRYCCIACDLTTPEQSIRRGILSEISASFKDDVRREFILIVSGSARSDSAPYRRTTRRR